MIGQTIQPEFIDIGRYDYNDSFIQHYRASKQAVNKNILKTVDIIYVVQGRRITTYHNAYSPLITGITYNWCEQINVRSN